jgi:hypothetical protein
MALHPNANDFHLSVSIFVEIKDAKSAAAMIACPQVKCRPSTAGTQ